ncbi:hypothetical protein Aspvir_005999 [Aspergillus viridinutans]|uniref:AMP-dependent synthetase/ligase domain-containing protein n=1 Tax=Aspergillus viridinutans TaxID=75553 RepID=A0A9P3FBF3_ASPVI|nr:uncharacterized protein Aspvir_005999 [Aspergillus viridinutans]GIK07931.1 hypothetical protein Aspvir_005999 [Aspergillus viridinutans]
MSMAEMARLSLGPGRCIAQVSAIGFDLAAVEISRYLLHGATLVLRDLEDPFDHLHDVHTIMTTPSFIAACSPDVVLELRTLVLGGVSIPQALADAWAHKQLFIYSPSECGPFSTPIQLQQGDKVTIGRRLPHVDVYILDHHQCPMADGYWNRSATPARKAFMPNPFRTEQEKIMYCMVTWTTIRGFRIELAEVEKAVRQADKAISNTAVIVADQLRIVAFMTPDDVDLGALLQALCPLLPSYVRPTNIILVPELPQSASMKVDRIALQTLAVSITPGQGELPETPTEKIIAKIWRELLQLPDERRTRRDDDFMGIGGYSVPAIKAARQILKPLRQNIPLMLIICQTALSDVPRTIDRFQAPEEPSARCPSPSAGPSAILRPFRGQSATARW